MQRKRRYAAASSRLPSLALLTSRVLTLLFSYMLKPGSRLRRRMSPGTCQSSMRQAAQTRAIEGNRTVEARSACSVRRQSPRQMRLRSENAQHASFLFRLLCRLHVAEEARRCEGTSAMPQSSATHQRNGCRLAPTPYNAQRHTTISSSTQARQRMRAGSHSTQSRHQHERVMSLRQA